MEFTLTKWEEKNVVFVYKTLDLTQVSLDKLKEVGRKYNSQTQIVELPDGLVVVFGDIITILRIDGRRFLVGDQGASTLEGTQLPHLAIDIAKALRVNKLEQVAFGFNYRFLIRLDSGQESKEFFRDHFLKDSETWYEKMGVNLTGFEPRFYLTRNQVTYDLTLAIPTEDNEPKDTVHVRANAHFAVKTRPQVDKFQKQLSEEYIFIEQLLKKL